MTIPKDDSLSVNISILVDAGAKNEISEKAGLAHFLEHMAFKGTNKRPTALQVNSEFDSLGADYNAYTSHDYTVYYLTVIPDYISSAFDLLVDIYKNPNYDSVEIEKEKGVVKEEIKLYEDKPSSLVWEVFTKLMYGDTTAGRPILGSYESVGSLNREDFLVFHKNFYSAENTLVVVSGKIEENKIISMAEEKFINWPSGKNNLNKLSLIEQTEPKINLFFKDLDQSHLVLGFHSFDTYDERVFVLLVLSGILGGVSSSRLVQKIREEMGVAYYVGSSQNSYRDHGHFTLYAGVSAERTGEVVDIMLEECRRLKNQLVGVEEIERVKASLVGRFLLGLETASDLSSFYGIQEILRKKIMNPEEIVAKIRAVEPVDVQNLAKEIFLPNKLSLAIVGPVDNSAEFLLKLSV